MKNLSELPLEELKNKKLFLVKFTAYEKDEPSKIIDFCTIKQIKIISIEEINSKKLFHVRSMGESTEWIIPSEHFDKNVFCSFKEAYEELEMLINNYFYEYEKKLMKEKNSIFESIFKENMSIIREEHNITDDLIDNLISEISDYAPRLDSESLGYTNPILANKLNTFADFIFHTVSQDYIYSEIDFYDESIVYFYRNKEVFAVRKVTGPGYFAQLYRYSGPILGRKVLSL